MINREIIDAFSQIAREKNIDRSTLGEIIESIFDMMIKKKYGTSDNFDIIVNMDKGEIEIYQEKKIVEKVKDPDLEIDLESAIKIEPDLEIGDTFVEVIDLESFGRRLITSAKQNLNQRIRDVEKEIIYEQYKDRIGEIIIGDVHQIRKDTVFINIDKTEVILPKSEQIYTEHYRRGESIRALIKEVKKTQRGPEIVVSRADPQFLVRLFEIEVPEIYDGIIDIKAVVREPGDRSKIAVESSDRRIDPVGACVGMKGIRIQSIVRELNNEKIDIINWSNEPEILIARTLSPAKPVRIEVNREKKRALAIIPDDEISLAIGKGGQNIRLASLLTGYEIETIKESELGKTETKLDEIEGLSSATMEKLKDNGFENVEDILESGVEELIKIKGIGEKTAKKIIDVIEDYFIEK